MLFAMKSLKCHWCVSIRLFVAVEQSFIVSRIVGSVILSLSVLLLLLLLSLFYLFIIILLLLLLLLLLLVVVVLLLPSSLLLAVSNEHKKEVDSTKRPLLKKIKGKVLNEDDCFYGQNKKTCRR